MGFDIKSARPVENVQNIALPPITVNPANKRFDVTTAKPMPIPQERNYTGGETLLEAGANLIPDIGRVVGQTVQGMASAVNNPSQTLGALNEVATGAMYKILPTAVTDFINKISPDANKEERIAKANAVGDYVVKNYGSIQGFNNNLAKNPAHVLADISSVLTLGGGALQKAGQLSKVSGLEKAGQATINAGNAVDPLAVGLQTAKRLKQGIGAGATATSGMLTGAGYDATKEMFKAGEKGGISQELATGNMRGSIPQTNVFEDAKSDLMALKQIKNKEYNSGMVDISNDKTMLDLTDIEAALQNAKQNYAKTSYGNVKNKEALVNLNEVEKAVNEWKYNKQPDLAHTPAGIDELKQRIGGILDSIPYTEKASNAAVGEVYNATKQTINKQAPAYAKVMKDYSEASDQIHEIERTLSLNPQASVDTSMRKLQSVMRNNVNTNFGNRLNLAKQLEEMGGKQIIPALAGQSFNKVLPRGLQSATAAPTAILSYTAGGIPAALASALLSSPRLAGETALKLGQAHRIIGGPTKEIAKAASDLGMKPQQLANYLYQIQNAQMNQGEQ
jgi:hypothetical protein